MYHLIEELLSARGVLLNPSHPVALAAATFAIVCAVVASALAR